MMSVESIMLMYLSCIFDGIPTCITIIAGDDLLLVFLFIDNRFGSNMPPDAIV